MSPRRICVDVTKRWSREKKKGLLEFGLGQHAGVAEWQTLRT
jgi:hypothetical protein